MDLDTFLTMSKYTRMERETCVNEERKEKQIFKRPHSQDDEAV